LLAECDQHGGVLVAIPAATRQAATAATNSIALRAVRLVTVCFAELFDMTGRLVVVEGGSASLGYFSRSIGSPTWSKQKIGNWRSLRSTSTPRSRSAMRRLEN
jgi:hypothetical protein